ncbi:right-handed parallel beta-helix repeat-containing protein, partial [Klebsiella pneumoniae]
MSLISETAQWESDIPLIKRGDKVAGGADGLVNVQTSILADRTAYLRDQLNAYNGLLKSGELPFTSAAAAQA